MDGYKKIDQRIYTKFMMMVISIKRRGSEKSGLCVSVGPFDLLVILHFFKKKINISKMFTVVTYWVADP